MPRIDALDEEIIASIALNATVLAFFILRLIKVNELAIDFNLHEVVDVLVI